MSKKQKLTEAEIDALVEAQAADDSAWEPAIRVRKAAPAAISIPAELAARAAFLAQLHQEKNLEDWLARIIKERVELEEVAFSQAKRELSATTGD